MCLHNGKLTDPDRRVDGRQRVGEEGLWKEEGAEATTVCQPILTSITPHGQRSS